MKIIGLLAIIIVGGLVVFNYKKTHAPVNTVSENEKPVSGKPTGEKPVTNNFKIKNISLQTLTTNGGRVDWSEAKNIIAFDRIDEQGYFQIWTMLPDSSQQQCLTCGRPEAPAKNKGNPAWHPSGKYIVFQAQNDFPGTIPAVADYFANPGAGINNDVWVMDSSGDQYWKLQTVPVKIGGVLHPHFSHSGNKLLWAERVSGNGGKYGQWIIRLADFVVVSGTPQLQNIQTFTPGSSPDFYETHGFTLDDKKSFSRAIPTAKMSKILTFMRWI